MDVNNFVFWSVMCIIYNYKINIKVYFSIDPFVFKSFKKDI